MCQCFLEQIIRLDDVAPGAAGEKLIEEHPDKEKAAQTRNAKIYALDFKQDLPARGRGDFDDDIK